MRPRPIRLLRSQPFDLLLLDKNLPRMNGLDLLRGVRARNATVPAILMTAYASAESATETLNLGVEAYLEKPLDSLAEVVRLISNVLGKKKPGWRR